MENETKKRITNKDIREHIGKEFLSKCLLQGKKSSEQCVTSSITLMKICQRELTKKK